MLEELGVERDGRGNVKGPTEGPNAYHTSIPGVFAASDMRRCQSLVVWAIREGRQCARAVDEWLMGGRIWRGEPFLRGLSPLGMRNKRRIPDNGGL